MFLLLTLDRLMLAWQLIRKKLFYVLIIMTITKRVHTFCASCKWYSFLIECIQNKKIVKGVNRKQKTNHSFLTQVSKLLLEMAFLYSEGLSLCKTRKDGCNQPKNKLIFTKLISLVWYRKLVCHPVKREHQNKEFKASYIRSPL